MPRNLYVIFLREENADGHGEYYYPDAKVGAWGTALQGIYKINNTQ